MAKFYSEKCKEFRLNNKIKTGILADKLGICRRTLWSLENNKSVPSDKKIYLIAKYLNVSPNQISDLKVAEPEFNTSLPEVRNPLDYFKREKDIIENDRFNDLISKIKNYHEERQRDKVITQALLTAIDLILYVKNIDLEYLVVNRSFIKNLNLPEEILIHGKKDCFFYPKNEARENTEMDAEVLRTGRAIAGREIYIPGTRKKKWGIISKYPIFASNNKVTGIVSACYDITERKKAEQVRALLEINQEAMSEALFIVKNATSRYFYVNKNVEKIYGYKPELYYKYGRSFFLKNCLHKNYRRMDFFTKHFNKITTAEYKIIDSKNRIRWIYAKRTPRFNYMGEECDIVIEKDITQFKENLKQQEMLKQAINRMTECTWIGMNRDSECTEFDYSYITPSIKNYFDVTEKEIYVDPDLLNNIRKKYVLHRKTSHDISMRKYILEYDISISLKTNPKYYEETIYVYEGYCFGIIRDISYNKTNQLLKFIYENNFDAMDNAITIWDVDNTQNIFTNRAHEAVFGLSKEKFLAEVKNPVNLITKYVHASCRETELSFLYSGNWPKSREYKIIKPDGSIRWIKTDVHSRKIAGIGYNFAVSKDITEENLTKQRRIILESAINSSDDLFWVAKVNDDSLELTFSNKSKKKFNANLFEKTFYHRYLSSSKHYYTTVVNDINKLSYPITNEYYAPSSGNSHCMMCLQEKIEKKDDYLFGTIRDITSMKCYSI
ncbi:MAG TPA: PAS domain-containing protein [Victivallales bacterium]|nr:PAS domain-containing protein [Victivallales bacterium]